MTRAADKNEDVDRKPAALSIEGVSKVYRRLSLWPGRWTVGGAVQAYALDDVSFRAGQGETIGLLGPNGAGKTTLLKIIATLLYPTEGRVLIHGQDIRERPVETRGLIGLVTCDERSFYWRLTGRQNLMFFAMLYGLTRKQATRTIEELLEVLGLTDAADDRFDGYSSGMKQKLAIARGLLSEPELVLYDEPTRSLDPVSTKSIRQWILEKRIRSHHQTHVIATNQLSEAEQLCDRVLIINSGRLIAHGSIQEICDRWSRREYELHRVTYRGAGSNDPLKPAPEVGLLAVETEEVDDSGTTVQLRVHHDSGALSYALNRIFAAGGEIVRCELVETPFDEVFCSLVLGDRDPDNGGERT
ncbi:MAG: ABC transporter ATP-binding protein [Phycisphaerales bacterium]|nr:MAG: ABC transporter ATP-binding protein [Phycisphaerales bacterium]